MIDQKLTITKIISITNSNHIFKGTDNQPRDASTSTTVIGIVNKYFADIQTSLTMGDKPLEFWLNSCTKAYRQLFLAVDLLAAAASQAFAERLFSVCEMLSSGRRNRMEKSLEMRVWLKVNFIVLRELECKRTLYETEMFRNE